MFDAKQENTIINDLPPVLTVDEVAELLRVNRKTVYGQFREKKIPGGKRVGRLVRFSRDVILTWLLEQQQVRTKKG